MQPETSNLVAAIEKQTALFRELEVALQASRTAYKARNLELIYIHLDSQTTLCARLRELQAEAARAAQREIRFRIVASRSFANRTARGSRRACSGAAERSTLERGTAGFRCGIIAHAARNEQRALELLPNLYAGECAVLRFFRGGAHMSLTSSLQIAIGSMLANQGTIAVT